MTMMTLTQNERPISSGFRVDVSRGERVGRVSSEWFSRPDDERYLSLTDLYDAVRRRAECAQVRTVESRAVKVEAARDNAERLALLVPTSGTHTLEFWAIVRACRRAIILSAAASRTVGRDQSATWLALTPRRVAENIRNR